jgi:hypothetical protein
MSVFGPVVTGAHVEQAAILTLKTWLQTYVAELERQTGRDPESVPMPRAWGTVNEFEKWPEDQMPVALIISPGLEPNTPVAEGRGTYRAKWVLGVAIVCSARDEAQTNSLAKFYAAAVRATILQNPSLGGFARGVQWVGESYTDLPKVDERTLGTGQVIFSVEVGEVVDEKAGMRTPPDDPYTQPEWPTVETPEVALQGKD